MLAEDDMARLFAAQAVAGSSHVLIHVLVAHSRLFIGNAFSFKCFVKPEIGHDGGDHGVVEQGSLLLHVFAADVHDDIAIHYIALPVHGNAAVRIAVIGKAQVASLLHHEVLQIPDMGGTAVRIDVQAVGVVVHHMGLRAQGIKHILGNGGRAAVGTVQGHLHVLKGTGCNGNQITDVAVAPGRKVHGAAYVLFSCQGDFADFPIQVFFNLQDNGFFQLLASFIDYLDTVVIEWIMAS